MTFFPFAIRVSGPSSPCLPRQGTALLGFRVLLLKSLSVLALAWVLPVSGAETLLVEKGVTEPLVDVVLSTSVPGIVAAQNFKEGDIVKKGDAILELDKRLEELEVSRRKLVMDMRKVDLDATRTLFEKTTSVSKEELDKKQADYSVAVVENEMAVEQLRRRLIQAPEDGVITSVLIDVGEATQAFQPLVHLVDPRRCKFECNLEARKAVHLKLNQTVRLEIDTGTDPASVTGKVVFLSPVADKASGLINVKVHFENPEGRIRPGLEGRMFFPE
jgi:RND family efflux transporter MFP subunit